jgi:hypothetical protein
VLAVPALRPAAEYFYATFAMPLRSPWLMAFLAFPGSATAFFAPWTFAALRCREACDGATPAAQGLAEGSLNRAHLPGGFAAARYRRTGCEPTLGAGDLLGGMLGSVALIA